MALTPDDVVHKRFETTRFRDGYDQDEVDDFLDGSDQDVVDDFLDVVVREHPRPT